MKSLFIVLMLLVSTATAYGCKYFGESKVGLQYKVCFYKCHGNTKKVTIGYFDPCPKYITTVYR